MDKNFYCKIYFVYYLFIFRNVESICEFRIFKMDIFIFIKYFMINIILNIFGD